MEKILAMHHLKSHGQELAQAYVPCQPFETTHCPEEAIKMGTVFPNLFQPYEGWKPYPICK